MLAKSFVGCLFLHWVVRDLLALSSSAREHQRLKCTVTHQGHSELGVLEMKEKEGQ